MKIVVVIDLYDQLTNGTIMTAYRFVEELKKKGHTVRVLATGAKGEDCYELPERYIPIVTEVSRLQQIRFAKPDFETIVNAFHSADVIHFYLPFKLEKKAFKIAKKMNIPCTAAFHLQPENITYNCGIRHSYFTPKILYAWFRGRFYKNFDHIHCPSKFIADQLRKHKYKAKLHVISNGVDEDFKPLKDYREAGEKFNILMIGRYATEKRQDVLIKAISMSKYRDRIHLTLAGKGPKEKKLRALAGKYLDDGAVEYGFYNKEQLIDVIHKSDLYVHTADIEIEAIACIEAISCGVVPVIANSKKSATPQFALDERSLFEAGNPKSLAEKIDYWIENPEERQEMSSKYVENSEKYRITHSIAKTEEMFKEAIASEKASKKYKTGVAKKEAEKVRRKIIVKSKILRFASWLLYYFIALPIMYFYCIVGYGLKIRGTKNLMKIKKSGAVSVSNHVHLMDAAMNGLALSPKHVVFTALEDNFDLPVAGWLLRLLGAIAVPKDYKYTDIFFDEATKLLKNKRIVHIYPEGQLVNYYGGFRDFKRGAFKLACDAQVPIIPVVISWRRRWGLNKLILPSKPCATITVGEPIYPNYLLLRREMEQDLMSRVKDAMQDIYDKSNKGESINIFKNRAYAEYKTNNYVYPDGSTGDNPLDDTALSTTTSAMLSESESDIVESAEIKNTKGDNIDSAEYVADGNNNELINSNEIDSVESQRVSVEKDEK